ncbi:MAG: TlpA disulfide reductase family protein [Chitinophagaceae bacterium]
MKNIFLFAFLSLLTPSLLSAQTILKEGVLKYTETKTRVNAAGKTIQRTVAHSFMFSQQWLRSDMEMNVRTNMATILNCSKGTATSYITNGQKFYEMDDDYTPDFPELGLYENTAATIEYLDDTKMIKGYNCKKAVMNCIIDGTKEKMIVWYLPGVKPETGCFNFFFKNLDGLPVSFSFTEHAKVVIGNTKGSDCEYVLDTFYTTSGAVISEIENKGKYEWIAENEKMNRIMEMLRPGNNINVVTNKGAAETEELKGANGASVTVTRFNPFKVGQTLENFEAKDVNGQKRTLDDYNGKLLVLNFWFTKCGPCIKEMPMLNKIAKANKDRNVSFVSITYNSVEEVVSFFKETSFDFEHLVDARSVINQYGVSTYPATVLIDTNRVVRFIRVGMLKKESDLQKQIDKLL